ncbi:MAG: hypothetical protein Q8S53_15880, partial [Brevundimonas sp.]|uniref:hypothetical protein n=1 Tax=Brevundimonas sp. TaxID=1871086 RepID=UPI0027326E48
MDHIGDALPSLMGLAKVYRAYDGAQILLEQEIGRPICVQCGKCCRENTPIAWGVEAANAVSHLIGQGRLYPMQRRIEGWLLERHSQCTIYNPPKLDTVQNGLDPKLRDEVIALSRAQCPFYEGGCLLHDSRPLVCRAW